MGLLICWHYDVLKIQGVRVSAFESLLDILPSLFRTISSRLALLVGRELRLKTIVHYYGVALRFLTLITMSAIPSLPPGIPGIATNGFANRSSSDNCFQLSDTPIENFRGLKIVVIGAGYSGIYCGIRIPERLRNIDLVIYEKNAGVGGTWYENRYDHISCEELQSGLDRDHF